MALAMDRALNSLSKLRSKSSKDLTAASREYPSDPAQYELLEDCGRGVSATVHRAWCIPTNEIVAVKKMNLENVNMRLDEVIHETQTMKSYHHPNVLPLHTSFVHGQDLWMVTPFMSGGSVLHIMKYKFPKGLDEVSIATIMKYVLLGLEYVHKNGGIHRDVKAGNILMDKEGVVRIGDFGVAATPSARDGDWKQDTSTRTTFVGTPCWMAPDYNSKADIWSVGITFLELANGHAPFAKFPPMKVLLMTLQGPVPQLDDQPGRPHFSKHMRNIIARCLQKDAKMRPTATELLQDKFFKQARDEEYLQRVLLGELPALGERVKMIREGKAATSAAENDRQLERSQEEYKRGVSMWNFDVASLKAQAAMDEGEGGSRGLASIAEEPQQLGEGEGSGSSSRRSTDDAAAIPTAAPAAAAPAVPAAAPAAAAAALAAVTPQQQKQQQQPEPAVEKPEQQQQQQQQPQQQQQQFVQQQAPLLQQVSSMDADAASLWHNQQQQQQPEVQQAAESAAAAVPQPVGPTASSQQQQQQQQQGNNMRRAASAFAGSHALASAAAADMGGAAAAGSGSVPPGLLSHNSEPSSSSQQGSAAAAAGGQQHNGSSTMPPPALFAGSAYTGLSSGSLVGAGASGGGSSFCMSPYSSSPPMSREGSSTGPLSALASGTPDASQLRAKSKGRFQVYDGAAPPLSPGARTGTLQDGLSGSFTRGTTPALAAAEAEGAAAAAAAGTGRTSDPSGGPIAEPQGSFRQLSSKEAAELKAAAVAATAAAGTTGGGAAAATQPSPAAAAAEGGGAVSGGGAATGATTPPSDAAAAAGGLNLPGMAAGGTQSIETEAGPSVQKGRFKLHISKDDPSKSGSKAPSKVSSSADLSAVVRPGTAPAAAAAAAAGGSRGSGGMLQELLRLHEQAVSHANSLARVVESVRASCSTDSDTSILAVAAAGGSAGAAGGAAGGALPPRKPAAAGAAAAAGGERGGGVLSRGNSSRMLVGGPELRAVSFQQLLQDSSGDAMDLAEKLYERVQDLERQVSGLEIELGRVRSPGDLRVLRAYDGSSTLSAAPSGAPESSTDTSRTASRRTSVANLGLSAASPTAAAAAAAAAAGGSNTAAAGERVSSSGGSGAGGEAGSGGGAPV